MSNPYGLFYSKGTSGIKSQPQKLTIENEDLIFLNLKLLPELHSTNQESIFFIFIDF